MSKVPRAAKKENFINFRNYFKEYCTSSSIHGIRYFGERRTYFERGWWSIVFLMCLSCCAYIITMVYQKWEDSPVIVSFANRDKPIYEIPFPAVTICPETKAIKTRYSHSQTIHKMFFGEDLTEEQRQHAFYMNLLCDSDVSSLLSSRIELYSNKTYNNWHYFDNDFFDFMFKVSPNIIIDNLLYCKWMNKEYDCEELFDLIVTDEGVCATFNMLDNSKIYKDFVLQNAPFDSATSPKNVTWTLEDEYLKHEDLDTYPRRALFSGAKNSLSLRLREPYKDEDDFCKLSLPGFKVTLHSPISIPKPSQHHVKLKLDALVINVVQPVLITTSETVKVFKPEKRECFFQNENHLYFFKLYSQQNCELECLTNFTLMLCGCVNFFMPRNNDTNICGALNKRCMEDAENILQMGQVSNILDIKTKKNNLKNDALWVRDCNCLPLCTDLSYDVETSVYAWDSDGISQSPPKYTRTPMSELVIYFKNNRFVTSRRHELYGPTDFIANFGGLLGLFTGFSILSLMEIIYFLTIRIICNIKIYGNWWGEIASEITENSLKN